MLLGVQYKLLCYTAKKIYSLNPYDTLKERGIKKDIINTLKLNTELQLEAAVHMFSVKIHCIIEQYEKTYCCKAMNYLDKIFYVTKTEKNYKSKC